MIESKTSPLNSTIVVLHVDLIFILNEHWEHDELDERFSFSTCRHVEITKVAFFHPKSVRLVGGANIC